MTTRACQKAGVAQTDHCVGGGGLKEKIPEVQDLDAAGKGSKVVEKIPQPSEKSKSPQVTLKLTTEGINIQEARVII